MTDTPPAHTVIYTRAIAGAGVTFRVDRGGVIGSKASIFEKSASEPTATQKFEGIA